MTAFDDRYVEKGLLRRIAGIFGGLSRPRSSREYKLALIELQRLKAPLAALFVPALGIAVLMVVTSVSGTARQTIKVDIAKAEESVEELVEETEPEPEPVDMAQEVDVSVDVAELPAPSVPAPAPAALPGGEPDKVAAVPSPVTMASVAGTVRMRGIGDGQGGDFGRQVGGGADLRGCLVGVLVDFSRDGSGEPKPGALTEARFWESIRSLAEANFAPSAFARFCVLPRKVALTHLFVNVQDAANGPRAFGVREQMRGWAAYYTGTLCAQERGRYRFVGYFDDALVMRINRRTVLEANWAKRGNKPMAITGWQASDKANCGKWASLQGIVSPMIPGDWFTLEPGRETPIEVLIGENGGGKIGGLVLIEKEGETYPCDHLGRPVWPIFCSRPLSFKEKDRLREYSKKHYKIGVDSPKFNTVSARRLLEKMATDDVGVEVDI